MPWCYGTLERWGGGALPQDLSKLILELECRAQRTFDERIVSLGRKALAYQDLLPESEFWQTILVFAPNCPHEVIEIAVEAAIEAGH